MKSSIDIIIPVYNVQHYLRQCVDSVLFQTYPKINVILVDDGSPDSCGLICDDYGEKFSNVKVLHKSNGGLSDARNKGLEIASSDYIMFLDSDDWIESTMVENMIDFIVSENLDFVACSSVLEFDNKTVAPSVSTNLILNQEDATKMVLNRKMNVSAWGKIYKRKLFKNTRYPYGCLHEDIPVIFEIISQSYRIGYIGTPYHHYRQQGGSISRSKYSKKNYDLYRFVREAASIVKKYPQLKKDYEGFYFFFIKSLLVLFADNDTKKRYRRDFWFYKTLLKRGAIKMLLNPTLSLKDKLSVPFLFSPWYNTIKNLVVKR